MAMHIALNTPLSTINELEQTELRQHIENYQLDKPEVDFPFSARLAAENGWTSEYTARVITEYKRFLVLAMTADHLVTPSEAVDQAWHLHLVYTQSYWEELCEGLLGKRLHHHPTEGGKSEDEKFQTQYTQTLASYQQAFGAPPPPDIWPEPAVRFAAAHHQWVNKATHAIVSRNTIGCLLALCGLSLIAGGFFSSSLGLILVGVALLVLSFFLTPRTKNSGDTGGCAGCAGCSGCGGCGG